MDFDLGEREITSVALGRGDLLLLNGVGGSCIFVVRNNTGNLPLTTVIEPEIYAVQRDVS